jgi:DNA-binding transcriptional ArsR family regulator
MDKEKKGTEFKNISYISSEIRWNIMDLLENRGEDGESFKRIAEHCSLKPTNLAYHLKILARKGLIEKDFVNEMGRRDYTRYRLTGKGRETWSSTDILLFGKEAASISGIHEIGYPTSIKIFPMELAPKVVKFKEVK